MSKADPAPDNKPAPLTKENPGTYYSIYAYGPDPYDVMRRNGIPNTPSNDQTGGKA